MNSCFSLSFFSVTPHFFSPEFAFFRWNFVFFFVVSLPWLSIFSSEIEKRKETKTKKKNKRKEKEKKKKRKMEIVRENFEEKLDEVKQVLEAATFVALDLELSGVSAPSSSAKRKRGEGDDPAESPVLWEYIDAGLPSFFFFFFFFFFDLSFFFFFFFFLFLSFFFFFFFFFFFLSLLYYFLHIPSFL